MATPTPAELLTYAVGIFAVGKTVLDLVRGRVDTSVKKAEDLARFAERLAALERWLDDNKKAFGDPAMTVTKVDQHAEAIEKIVDDLHKMARDLAVLDSRFKRAEEDIGRIAAKISGQFPKRG